MDYLSYMGKIKRANIMNKQTGLILLLTILVSACGSTPPRQTESGIPATPNAQAGQGGYLAGDGPGADAPADLAAIPDAVPRAEPLHRYANRPYVALGKNYTPLATSENYKERGIASWYGKKFHGQRTSSGEVYDMYGMTAAHPTLPIPSYVRVTNLSNHKSVVVRVNDRGPFLHERIIDLSYTAANKLGIIGSGSGKVEVESLIADAMEVTTVPIIENTVSSEPLENSPPNSATPVVLAPLETNNNSIYLQLGAFESQQNAEIFLERMRADLGDTGKQLKLSTIRNGLVRVHIGPYSSQSAARSSAEHLEQRLGFKPMINLP